MNVRNPVFSESERQALVKAAITAMGKKNRVSDHLQLSFRPGTAALRLPDFDRFHDGLPFGFAKRSPYTAGIAAGMPRQLPMGSYVIQSFNRSRVDIP